MRWLRTWLGVGLLLCNSQAQESAPLEPNTTPFDFDHYQKTPFQTSHSRGAATKLGPTISKSSLKEKGSKSKEIQNQVAGLVQDPVTIPLHPSPEKLPTRSQLADQMMRDLYGSATKASVDSRNRARVIRDFDLDTMSDEDYAIFAANYVADARLRDQVARPFFSMSNSSASETGRTPRGYSSRGEIDLSNDNQNPFEDLVRALRLDRHVTKSTDLLPSPSIQAAPTSRIPSAGAEPGFSQLPTETTDPSP